jgi:hypothetical protein
MFPKKNMISPHIWLFNTHNIPHVGFRVHVAVSTAVNTTLVGEMQQQIAQILTMLQQL